MTERTRLCDRCLKEVEEGIGAFFEVRIDAIADPTPPVLNDKQSVGETGSELSNLLNQLSEVSEVEAAEEVFQRRIYSLCRPCFRVWSEKPFGDG